MEAKSAHPSTAQHMEFIVVYEGRESFCVGNDIHKHLPLLQLSFFSGHPVPRTTHEIRKAKFCHDNFAVCKVLESGLNGTQLMHYRLFLFQVAALPTRLNQKRANMVEGEGGKVLLQEIHQLQSRFRRNGGFVE